MVDYMQEERALASDLLENSADRVMICICVDASFSMIENNRIKNVNNGIKKFIQNSLDDIYARDAIDLCIISFGGEDAEIIQPFDNVKQINFQDIKPNGETPMGEAINLAINEIKKRLEQLDMFGRTHFKPWLIIMSDGKSTDKIESAASRTRELLENRTIKVQCIDMSESDETTDLEAFTLDGDVGTISSFEIEDFFSMLSRSVAGLSKSTPGEDELNEINSYANKG